jgi:VIT1/CCC1 family predicted Fe2+/Mn2+ transporter
LRAAVLGANDGIVSTASLILGVAAGEYVSVRSQADTETADLAREREELASDVAAERRELASIYVKRGLEPALAEQVAVQLMAHDALGAHARDELGISAALKARPVQAALASAGSFSAGAALPLAVVAVAPAALIGVAVAGSSLVFLAGLGTLAARTGGAPVIASAWRVTFWGALAMALTAGVGAMFGAAVS